MATEHDELVWLDPSEVDVVVRKSDALAFDIIAAERDEQLARWDDRADRDPYEWIALIVRQLGKFSSALILPDESWVDRIAQRSSLIVILGKIGALCVAAIDHLQYLNEKESKGR